MLSQYRHANELSVCHPEIWNTPNNMTVVDSKAQAVAVAHDLFPHSGSATMRMFMT